MRMSRGVKQCGDARGMCVSAVRREHAVDARGVQLLLLMSGPHVQHGAEPALVGRLANSVALILHTTGCACFGCAAAVAHEGRLVRVLRRASEPPSCHHPLAHRYVVHLHITARHTQQHIAQHSTAQHGGGTRVSAALCVHGSVRHSPLRVLCDGLSDLRMLCVLLLLLLSTCPS